MEILAPRGLLIAAINVDWHLCQLHYRLSKRDVLLKFPPLEYPVTRRFDVGWLTSFAYVLGFLVVGILAIANVALMGYDPTTVLQANFNVTQTPGTLCDTRVFNVSESMVANSSLFEWKVQAVYQPNAAESGFLYRREI
ncbi:hypothetical protein EST38_g7520 [Candolleomyces aberdarensis]|uniref:Uncharacterized protein n=1 Tax=Candolleomyces aberdarensis TaxID=2316362 RepID=A0A4Q2DIA1_9AGAR|nr:hypothetical protein EST38_g7520 [Candolleomyces aberdarensis]